jgi:hypothetical protein
LRRFAGRFGGQSRLKSIGHARVENDALLLEPEAARSELANLSWGKV